MIRFECDYAEGAHPLIMQALVETNMEQTPGYSTDEYCGKAREYIKKACGSEDISVEFMVGGTQANATVISACLRPHQGVLCPISAHINTHETGAIEACGHKVLTLASDDGKVKVEQLEAAWNEHVNDANREHVVQPGMVFISQPTEIGTLYSLKELTEISEFCRKSGLIFYIDGARLGYALGAPENDASLKDITKLTDVFYIGGTKVGALFGEAVVIPNKEIQKDFRYHMKQHGGLMAKGRLLGIQFKTLFEDSLYYDISKQAVAYALRIKEAFAKCNVQMLVDSPTNQQFPILHKSQMEKLAEKYSFTFWERIDENYSCVRFCISWAAKEEQIQALEKDILDICK
ncbi:threonine aldolase family protein [Breznakia pachnodae]|uniref:Threonine aldolase n=1 Tax=Breznakia pachnodae TaxID=265178 RepID=A0ABU0E7P2_9FIRM|nr:aminotransferase class I/II-fold pyridoxal phosphate-dependent enzyme [Breznakia pachnodae]MDQ0362734.1 threonine aldolase [Breznakia pachnodae]